MSKKLPLYKQNSTNIGEPLQKYVNAYFSSFSDSDIKAIIIDAILNDKSVTRAIEKELNLCTTTALNRIKKFFPNKIKNIAYKTHILVSFNKKQCANCKLVFDLEYFNSNISRRDKLSGGCIYCHSKYIHNDLPRYRNLAAQKKLLTNMAISTAYKTELEIIYANCLDGYHVDHIVPINGNNVCGLHVPWNLQYLSIADNLSKGNKFYESWD